MVNSEKMKTYKILDFKEIKNKNFGIKFHNLYNRIEIQELVFFVARKLYICLSRPMDYFFYLVYGSMDPVVHSLRYIHEDFWIKIFLFLFWLFVKGNDNEKSNING